MVSKSRNRIHQTWPKWFPVVPSNEVVPVIVPNPKSIELPPCPLLLFTARERSTKRALSMSSTPITDILLQGDHSGL